MIYFLLYLCNIFIASVMITNLLTFIIVLALTGLITTLVNTHAIPFTDPNFSQKVAKYKSRKALLGFLFFSVLIVSIIIIDQFI